MNGILSKKELPPIHEPFSLFIDDIIYNWLIRRAEISRNASRLDQQASNTVRAPESASSDTPKPLPLTETSTVIHFERFQDLISGDFNAAIRRETMAWTWSWSLWTHAMMQSDRIFHSSILPFRDFGRKPTKLFLFKNRFRNEISFLLFPSQPANGALMRMWWLGMIVIWRNKSPQKG